MPDAEFYKTRMGKCMGDILDATADLKCAKDDDDTQQIRYWCDVLITEVQHIRYLAIQYENRQGE